MATRETKYTVKLVDGVTGVAGQMGGAADRLGGAFKSASQRVVGSSDAATKSVSGLTAATVGGFGAVTNKARVLGAELQGAGARVETVSAKPIDALLKLDAAFARVSASIAGAYTSAVRGAAQQVQLAIVGATAPLMILQQRAEATFGAIKTQAALAFIGIAAPLGRLQERAEATFGRIKTSASVAFVAAAAPLGRFQERVEDTFARSAKAVDQFAARVAVSFPNVTRALNNLQGRFTRSFDRVRAATGLTGLGVGGFAKRVTSATGTASNAVKGLSSRVGVSLTRAWSAARTQLTGVAGGIRDYVTKLKGADDSQQKAGASGTGMLKIFAGNLLANAVGRVAQLGAEALSAAVSFTTLGQNAEFAMNKWAKGKAPGAKLLEHSSALARRFGLDLEATTQQYTELMTAGQDAGSIDTIIRLGASMKAMGNTKALTALPGILDAIGNKGAIRRIGAIDQLGQLEISREDFKRSLEKVTGEQNINLDAKIKGGKIDAASARDAILDALQTQMGEKQAGDIGAEFADNTLTGAQDRIKATAADALMQIGGKVSTGAARGLSDVADQFDRFVSSKEGVETIDAIAKGITDVSAASGKVGSGFGSGFLEGWKLVKSAAQPVIDMFAGSDGKASVDAVVGLGKALGYTAAIAVGVVGFAVASLAAIPVAVAFAVGYSIEHFGEFLDWLGGVPGRIGNWFGELGSTIASGVDSVFDGAFSVGEAVATGIWKGIKAFASSPVEAVKSLASSVISAAKETFGINSPSKEGWDIGGNFGQSIGDSAASQSDYAYGKSENLAEASIGGASDTMAGASVQGPQVEWSPLDSNAGALGFMPQAPANDVGLSPLGSIAPANDVPTATAADQSTSIDTAAARTESVAEGRGAGGGGVHIASVTLTPTVSGVSDPTEAAAQVTAQGRQMLDEWFASLELEAS